MSKLLSVSNLFPEVLSAKNSMAVSPTVCHWSWVGVTKKAPVPGVYFFYYGVYTANTDSGNGFGIQTNNGEIDQNTSASNFFSFTTGTDDILHTASLVFPLTSGDTVWVSARTDSDFYSGHSYFGGCRLK